MGLGGRTGARRASGAAGGLLCEPNLAGDSSFWSKSDKNDSAAAATPSLDPLSLSLCRGAIGPRSRGLKSAMQKGGRYVRLCTCIRPLSAWQVGECLLSHSPLAESCLGLWSRVSDAPAAVATLPLIWRQHLTPIWVCLSIGVRKLRGSDVPRRASLDRECAITFNRVGNQEGEPMDRDLGAD